MRMMRLGVAIAGAMAFTSAYAFHSGGVAECGGCHAIHKADSTGAIIGATNTNLLNGNTVSETCLGCHAHDDAAPSSYHILSTTTGAYAAGVSPVERTPGGDFGWLLKTYTYTDRSGAAVSWNPGGHGINAPAFGFPAQAGMSPGGNFPAASLGCSSCHDPHGKARTDANGNFVAQNANKIIGSGSYTKLAAAATGETNNAYGTYRLLYTSNDYYATNFNGPVPATIQGGQVTFSAAPLAVAPSTYNQSEAVNQVRVAYANLPSRTVSLWCASCHQAMHTNSGKLVHPVDAALNTGGENGYYNRYVNSGNQNGSAATAFLSLVPFGSDGASRSALAALSSNTNSAASLAGPGITDTVMCLSCHRAHASAFPASTRWSNDNEFLTGIDTAGNPTWPGSDKGSSGNLAVGKTAAETQASYYDRPVSVFGAYQRSLCNKCHAQD